MGLGRYEQLFHEHEIDADILLKLTSDDLKEIGVTAVGHRRMLLEAIQALQPAAEEASKEIVETPTPISAPKKIEAERRQLTVLFCDLVGSTKISERLDPEDFGHLIRDYQIACREVVERWGGHLANYMGDGVLVYFGWPQAHEDDAERAVSAGLELIKAVPQLPMSDGEALAARVGIATGLVMVGDLAGEGAAQERAVVGEPPHLAARLQSLAEPNQVILAEATRQLLGELFSMQDMGFHALKGFGERQHVWQALSESAVGDRFEALHSDGLSSFVGREEELRQLVSRWQLAGTGEGQVVLLSGEAGIGKSRLLRSLVESIEPPFWRLSYQCSPHHSSSPMDPVLRQLERAAGFNVSDTSAIRLDKLENLLGQAIENVKDAAALLASAMLIPTESRYPKLELTAQTQKYKTFDVLIEQLEGLASQRPVLIALEDVHWIDPTTEELFGFIIERVEHLPVFIVATFRPHFRPAWIGHAAVTQLPLGRLTQTQVKALTVEIAGAADLPSEHLEEIIVKTDGVPLFVEELTKAVIESKGPSKKGQASREFAIPATLQESLLARLDNLSSARSIAQMGSVLGREFNYDLLSKMTSMKEVELGEALDQLCLAELLTVRGKRPTATYAFKHALVRDAAYSTLLRSRRLDLHGHAGAALERLFETRLDEVSHLLAHHFSEAGDSEKAIGYLIRSVDRSIQAYALNEAETSLLQGLSLTQNLRDASTRTTLRLGLKQRLSHCYYLLGRFGESAQTLLDEADVLDRGDDPETTAPCLFSLSHILLRLARYEEAAHAAETCLTQADGIGDATTKGKVYGALCLLGALKADSEAGQAAGLQSATLLQDQSEPYWLGMTKFYQGMIDIALGRFDAAAEFGGACNELGIACNDARLQTYGMFLSGWALANSGAHEDGIERCTRAVEHAVDPTSRAYASAFLAYTRLEAGDDAEALLSLAEGLGGMRAVGFRPFFGLFSAMLAEAQRKANRLSDASVTADQAILEATKFSYPLGLGWAQRARAKTKWDKGDHQGIVELRGAYETFMKAGAKFETSRTLMDLAQAHEGLGNQTDADEHRAQASELLTGIRVTYRPEMYKFILRTKLTQ